jgi:hypothetical protein
MVQLLKKIAWPGSRVRSRELLRGHLDVGAQPHHAQLALALREHRDLERRDRRIAGKLLAPAVIGKAGEERLEQRRA